ncbi:MAG: hypothetical protein AB1801_04380, partial [Chloroflexota bacterium]
DYEYEIYPSGDRNPALLGVTTTRQDFFDDPSPLVSYAHFDGFGNVDRTWTGNDSRQISLAYDSSHHTFLDIVTYPDGSTEDYEYDAGFGLLVSKTANGLTTTYTPDTFGRVDLETGPYQNKTDYDYTHFPEITITYQGDPGTNEDDYQIIQLYNGLGQLIHTEEPGGSDGTNLITLITDYSYDGLGRLATASVPNQETGEPAGERLLANTYDALGRPIDAGALDGNGKTHYEYSGWTQVQGLNLYELRVTDPANHVKTYRLDAFGQVRQVIEREESEAGDQDYLTAYTYDTLGNLTTIIDAGGNETSIQYDNLGRKRELTDPDMGAWLYTYNIFGEPATQTDARGVKTSLSYDNLGRLDLKTYDLTQADPADHVASTPYVDYIYNGLNSTTLQNGDAGNQISRVYDPHTRTLTEQQWIPGRSAPFSTVYHYDYFDRLQTITYPDGEQEQVTMAYNRAGQVESVRSNNGAIYLQQATYNALGQPKNQNLGDAIQRTVGYDDLTFRPKTVTTNDGNLQNLQFGFGPLGRLAAYTNTNFIIDTGGEGQDGPLSQTYEYDTLGRLRIVESNLSYQTYDYDPLGNLRSRNGTPLLYEFEGRPHLATAYGNVSFGYDHNGNLRTRTEYVEGEEGPVTGYTYDAENRLVEVQGPEGTAAFLYDGEGRLVRRSGPDGKATYSIGDYYQLEVKEVVTGRWEEPTPRSGESDGHQRTPHLTSDAQGRLYLVWSEEVNIPNTGYFVGSVRLATRAAIGGEWSTPVTVSTNPTDQSLDGANTQPVAAVDPAGQVYVAWQEFDDTFDRYEVHYRHRTPAGQWSVETVDVTPIQAGPPRPSLAAATHSALVYLAWTDYDQDFNRQVVRVRELSQGQFEYETAAGQGGHQFAPDLAVDSQGNVTLAYVESGDPDLLKIARRDHTTGSWTLDPGPGDNDIDAYVGLAVATDSQDNLYAAWNGQWGTEEVRVWRRLAGDGSWAAVSTYYNHPYYGLDLVVDEAAGPQVISGDGADSGVTQIFVNGETILSGPTLYYASYPTIATGPNGTLAAVWEAEPDHSYTNARLYLAEYFPAGYVAQSTTKRYYAPSAGSGHSGDQQLALRVNDTLYYTLPDPTGASLTITDENGEQVGYLLYDAYGNVLEKDLSPELETALAGQGAVGDPDTGLVHLGGGRFYDPGLGRPLQPNPTITAPMVPQALNRYSATPIGQPGVGEGASTHLHPLLVTAGKGVLKSTISATIGRRLAALAENRLPFIVAYRPTGRMELTLFMSRWARYKYFASGAASPFEGSGIPVPGWGRSFRAYAVRGLVTEIEPGLFLMENGELVETGALPKSATVLTAEMLRPVNITRFIAGGAFAFVLSAGVQYLGDVGNPYLSSEQISRRVSIAGVGGTIAWGVGTGTTLALAWAGAGAWAGPIGIGTGFVTGFIWFGFVQPVIFEGSGLSPKRNLAPLL